MGNLEKRLRSLSRVGLFIALGALITIMLLTVANTIARGLISRAVMGAYEVSGLMLVVVAVFAMLYAVLEGTNIRVEIILSRVPRRTREILVKVTSVISLGIMAVVSWAAVKWVAGGAFRGKTEALGISHLPFQIIWVLGLLLLWLALLINLYKALRRR